MVREQKILSPPEAQPVRQGDYVYLLAPPEKAQALDRFFVDMPPPAAPDPRLLGDFFVSGEVTLGALADIYGLSIAPEAADISLADHIADELKRRPKQGDIVPLGPIALLAHRVADGRVTIGRPAAAGRRRASRQRLRPGSRRPRALCGRGWADRVALLLFPRALSACDGRGRSDWCQWRS